ncbi:MAG: hypothetical protein AAGA96_13815 [Verrucomicrobiota bacterium]
MKLLDQGAGLSASGSALLLLSVIALFAMTSCETTSSGGRGSSGQLPSAAYSNPAVKARNAEIALESPADYYVGRRYWVDGTRFWGYLRKPGKPWTESQLVIMNESVSRQPDRIPEEGGTKVHGYDHNHEYRIWGSFTGQKIYDPNSNFIIPEFKIRRYELINSSPGFLFWPGESYNPRKLPPKHPPLP